ncbi:5 -nucleotidase domain-containing 4 isoform X1 isoform A [Chlorella sorokiniana]|uniref:5-nucleotidase domain-containing 4 isoform X1 isoform A n=1 Tax=Chlorella sorokiniana TaxID=3076 RepID=A0A2P6TW13_CHLSO|nr:5 -nucleotidase domain-containing 4 isoform X1 isoform A [Chlorella sorokiniana]|eukprot:PRW58251.1 5 -nucleotidase domain-containing 4 isoform X1 isoform A [Chlorella sorokiniana]
MSLQLALPGPLDAAHRLRRHTAAAQARPRLLARPPPRAAADARCPRLAATPDDPRHFGDEHREEEEEEESSDAEEFDTIAGAVEVVDEDEAEIDLFGESTRGNLHFASSDEEDRPPARRRIDDVLGLRNAEDILHMPWGELRKRTNELLGELGVPPSTYPASQPQRALFTNRTLNLRAIEVIGYDLDYTIIHYDVDAWEGKAYMYGLQSLREMGCPVEGLRFDRSLVIRGLIMDTELGNLVKADRFGFVKRAMHGTRMLSPAEVRESYGRELVNLRNESRFIFLNTLFSISEAVLYMQMVDRLDADMIPQQVCSNSYAALHKMVAKALFRAHVEGKLKAEIIQDPERYVSRDPEMAQTLLDQRQAGKALLLITNSDYHYTHRMMSYAYDCFLPEGQTWRDLFDMVIVNARKPDFFISSMSLYEVVTEDGLMRPSYSLKRGGVYCGGSAALVEKALGVTGDSILYVGDHIYTDAALAKMKLNWRTALIIAELEAEIEALAQGRQHRKLLKELLNKKDMVGDVFNQLRLARQRGLNQTGVVPLYEHLGPTASLDDEQELNDTLGQLLMVMSVLDEQIGPMIEADGMHFNRRWGYLSRAGVNDKSQLMRQIEKYADIFTSRVSNFLRYTPFEYFRSPAQLLVHDRPTADALVLSSGVLSSSDHDTGAVPSNGGSQPVAFSSYAAPRSPFTNGANGGTQWPQSAGVGKPGGSKPVRPAY